MTEVFVLRVDTDILGVFHDEPTAKIVLADFVLDPDGGDFEEAAITHHVVDTPALIDPPFRVIPFDPTPSDSYYLWIKDDSGDVWAHIGDGGYTLLDAQYQPSRDAWYRDVSHTDILERYGLSYEGDERP